MYQGKSIGAVTGEGSLASRTRGITAESTQTQQAVPAGRSEPLGGGGEQFVDAALRGGGGVEFGRIETEAETETETERQGITDEMREMAGEATGTQQLRRAYDEFATDVRAQSQLGLGRRRGATESEFEQPDSSFEDVRQDALTQYQDYLGGQRRAELEAERAQFRDFETESERRRAAERSEVRTESEVDTEAFGIPRTETFIDADEDTGIDVGVEPGVRSVTIPGTDVAIESAQDVRTDFETLFETEFEAETETETEFESEFETELETEQELEQEFETKMETETRRELFDLPDFGDGGGPSDQPLFGELRGERVTAFLDPLSGERLGE